MAQRWTRRGVLALLAGGFVAGLGAIAWRGADAPDLIVAILRRRLGFLQLEDGVFERFSESYLEARAAHRRQLAWLAILAGPLRF